jgi:hypothetical protein
MTIMSMNAAIARSVIGAIGEIAMALGEFTFCGATPARGPPVAAPEIDSCMVCFSFVAELSAVP